MSGLILALESSCDESAVAILDPATGLRGEWVHSQIALHERYGGVVPDLATREHLRNLPALLARARDEVGFGGVGAVAVTHGPGLAACLALGVAAAKSLALALRVPLLGVNHLRGHAWSPFLPVHAAVPAEFPARLAKLLPHLGLIVSGGNTLLFVVDEARRIAVLARTLDDAAGEALDKGAKLLGLGYPGGPEVERRAREGRADAFAFPRGGGRGDELDFSFSGLKTSLRYQLERMTVAEVEARRADLCASYQAAVIDALTARVRRVLAREGRGLCSLGLSGGVANNRLLRAALEAEARRAGIPFLAAEPRHTGDNAGMIAFAAAVDPAGAVTGDPCRLRIEPDAPLAG